MNAIAGRYGCDLSALVGLWPFIVDDSFIAVLASMNAPVRSSDHLVELRATVARQMQASELHRGFQFGRPRSTVYIDERLLEHGELLFCLDPPYVYGVTTPASLSSALGANVISLRRTLIGGAGVGVRGSRSPQRGRPASVRRMNALDKMRRSDGKTLPT